MSDLNLEHAPPISGAWLRKTRAWLPNLGLKIAICVENSLAILAFLDLGNQYFARSRSTLFAFREARVIELILIVCEADR